MTAFATLNEALKTFKDKHNSTVLDNKLGFSFKIELEDDLLKRLCRDKVEKYFSLFYIMLDNRAINKDQSNIIPLHLRFVLCKESTSDIESIDSRTIDESLYIINYIDYNTYYFNIKSCEFYKKVKGKYNDISIDEIFSEAYTKHLNRRNEIKAPKPIEKSIKRKCYYIITKYIRNILTLLYTIVTGKKIKYSISMFGETQFQDQIIEVEEIVKAKISFFNIDINIIPITSYSICHLVGYLIFYFKSVRPAVYITILKTDFLLAMYIIVSLVFYQYAIGGLLKITAKIFSYLNNKLRIYSDK